MGDFYFRVMNEFVKQSVGNHDDRLVYYIPCSYVYKWVSPIFNRICEFAYTESSFLLSTLAAEL